MSAEQIVVDLRPYTGLEKRRGKLRKATRPQKWVWLQLADETPQRVGLVSDTPGKPFCATIPIAEFSDAELEAINQAISHFHGVDASEPVGPPEDVDSDDEELDLKDDAVFVEGLDDEPELAV